LYVLFGSHLKIFNLATIEIIWLFFCLFNIFVLFDNFFGSFDLDPMVMAIKCWIDKKIPNFCLPSQSGVLGPW